MHTNNRRSRILPTNARPRTAMRVAARTKGRTLDPAAPSDRGPWTLTAGAALVRKFGRSAVAQVMTGPVAPRTAREIRRQIKTARTTTPAPKALRGAEFAARMAAARVAKRT